MIERNPNCNKLKILIFSRKSDATKSQTSSPLANKKVGKSEKSMKEEKSPQDENSSDGRFQIYANLIKLFLLFKFDIVYYYISFEIKILNCRNYV